MDIYLVRHGEAAASWGQASDPGLSDLGRSQAQANAEALAPQLPSDVQLISSPLLRARETALPLSTLMALPLATIDDAFSEIPSPVGLDQRQEWLREFMRQTWEGQAQTLQDWRTRMLDTLLGLQKPSVVFTHFLVMNTVVGAVQDKPETLCFWPDNASVVKLKHAGKALELVELGRQMSTVVN